MVPQRTILPAGVVAKTLRRRLQGGGALGAIKFARSAAHPRNFKIASTKSRICCKNFKLNFEIFWCAARKRCGCIFRACGTQKCRRHCSSLLSRRNVWAPKTRVRCRDRVNFPRKSSRNRCKYSCVFDARRTTAAAGAVAKSSKQVRSYWLRQMCVRCEKNYAFGGALAQNLRRQHSNRLQHFFRFWRGRPALGQKSENMPSFTAEPATHSAKFSAELLAEFPPNL